MGQIIEGLKAKNFWTGEDDVLTLEITEYRKPKGRVALQLWCEDGPYATVSVNLPNEPCKEGQFFVDTNNCPWAEAWLEKNDIATDDGYLSFSGYCAYPRYTLNPMLMDLDEKGIDGTKTVVKGSGRKYYAVLTDRDPYTDGKVFETIVVRCKKDGTVTNWNDLDSVRTCDEKEAKANHATLVRKWKEVAV